MSFKEGDIITITKDDNHFGKEGVISKQYKPEFNVLMPRWVVIFPDHPTNTRFIFYENDISLSIQYKRDEKLKSLGIK